MKDAKILSLLFFSLLLVLFSGLILLITWGYYKFYYNKDQDKHKTQIVAGKALDVNYKYRDSLQELYTTTINNLNTNFDKTSHNLDSAGVSPELNTAAFYKLKNEIEQILKNHPLKEDLNLASKKIAILQNKITELNNKNLSVEDENKRLNGKLVELSKELKGVEQQIKTEKSDDISVKKNTPLASTFTVSQINISAIMINDDGEQETTRADETDKFIGSLIVKNTYNHFNGVDLMVVVLQPGGRVLQGSPWESGSFETNDGRKIYSVKVHFDYSAGESKRLSFSLSANKYPKGEYKIQVFYNGAIIARASKTLV